MSHIKYFTNDNFRILAYLYDAKSANGKVHITQQEVADDLEISRATVNKIMGELRETGYIEQDGKHVGRYILTENALSVIETFRNVGKSKNEESYNDFNADAYNDKRGKLQARRQCGK